MHSISFAERAQVDLHLVKHAVGVEIKVTRGLPEVCLGNVRCVEQLVALPKVGVLQAAMLARLRTASGVATHPEASKP